MKLRYIALIIIGLGLLYFPVKFLIDSLSAKPVQAEAATGITQQQQALLDDPALDGHDGIYDKTEFTPSSYIPPQYDPFLNKYNPDQDYVEPDPTALPGNSAPSASFTLRQTKEGFPVVDGATVGTEFTFTASQSRDNETKSTKLQVRWDFDGDGTPESYYSYQKSIKHTFDKVGEYNVTLEVLDEAGNVSKTSKKVTIVENTPPTAYQIATPKTGTPGTIFQFDTRNSSDSQYRSSVLEYRFDWDNDGVYDTPYDKKTAWRHQFDKAGAYHVVMQVQDPEGLTSTYYQDVTVDTNNLPTASFVILAKPYVTSKATTITYYFDATTSYDTETPSNKLLYRWDFDYTGEDDIVYDTNYSTSPKYSGQYHIEGQKTVRLQVKDQDGATSVAYAELVVGE